ncbi:hypothetical protein [Roseinatronobacter alkalisoli]|uniref:Uncharacterized protein n=1 Tax=Roseinatronobacter alkalisoli TaxID=3028235 RepID=A0ABT5TEU1_9RHOB|nr:hypothetical protein [Roseinatronobacter sp. HJB301]MDD7973647.1 hypothetical protein [Roseinatronobacter sp. HJB301]
MTLRLRTFLTGCLALLLAALLALAPVGAKPASGGYQLFGGAASDHQADISLATLGNFDYFAKIAPECCIAPNNAGSPAIYVDSKGNAIVGGWSSTRRLTSPENALGHWNKHRTEFPEYSNAAQYVEGAQTFVRSPPATALTKTRGADTLIYDPPTNTFAVKTSDGVPRTMFRPSVGIDYWNRQ